MNKKILIGSIIAVSVLILISFNPAVGVQSVRNSVKDSPLFTVRAKRAINEEQDALASNYMGKGNGINLAFPTRDGKTVQIQKLIDRINQMDDKTFTRFVTLFIYQANHNSKMEYINNNAIRDALYNTRTNPKLLKNHIIDLDDNVPLVTKAPYCFTLSTCDSTPDCNLAWFLLFLIIIFVLWFTELTSKAWCN